jgi:hypothetical protein
MKRHELEEIIMEELESMLSEIMAENFIMESLTAIDEKKKQGRTKYTSSGTVPSIRGRKMSPGQVEARKGLGRTILKAVNWGNQDTNPVKRGFYKWAQQNDRPIKSDKDLYSFVWAMASDYAIKGDPLPAVITRAASGPMSTRGSMNLKKGPDRKKVAAKLKKKKEKARLAPKKAAEKGMEKKIKTPSTAKKSRKKENPAQLDLKGTGKRKKAPAKKSSTKSAPAKKKSSGSASPQTDLFK